MATSHPPPLPPTVRAMTADDLPAACELWTQAEGVELAEGDSLAQLTGYLLRNPGMSQVACAGARVVAAVLAGHDGRRGFLYHLAVEPDARGQGLGRALVERSLTALKAAGVSRVLILVARDNPGGANFWRRLGFDSVDIAEPMGRDL